MQNDDVVKILIDLKAQIDALMIFQDSLKAEAYNEGLIDALIEIENVIQDLSTTPNQIKKNAGLYHN